MRRLQRHAMPHRVAPESHHEVLSGGGQVALSASTSERVYIHGGSSWKDAVRRLSRNCMLKSRGAAKTAVRRQSVLHQAGVGKILTNVFAQMAKCPHQET